MGALVIFGLCVLAAIFLALLLKVTSRQGPTLTLHGRPKGLGQSTQLIVDAIDTKHNLTRMTAEVIQDGKTIRQSALMVPPSRTGGGSSGPPSR